MAMRNRARSAPISSHEADIPRRVLHALGDSAHISVRAERGHLNIRVGDGDPVARFTPIGAHHYSDLRRRRPIWFGGTDRSDASMDAFFAWLGEVDRALTKTAYNDPHGSSKTLIFSATPIPISRNVAPSV